MMSAEIGRLHFLLIVILILLPISPFLACGNQWLQALGD